MNQSNECYGPGHHLCTGWDHRGIGCMCPLCHEQFGRAGASPDGAHPHKTDPVLNDLTRRTAWSRDRWHSILRRWRAAGLTDNLLLAFVSEGHTPAKVNRHLREIGR